MNIERYAAFADGDIGGNPAGVVLCEGLPQADEMQRVAAEIGYSETVFAAHQGTEWRVRYFAPQIEVPFCGHATVALGGALARHFSDGVFALQLNDGRVTVEGRDGGASATLRSPPPRSRPAPAPYLADAIALFGLSESDLDPSLPPAIVHGGADHLLLALRSRERLAQMQYDFEQGRALMASEGLATISLVVAAGAQLFHARNPFAVGGVYEDPATGAAAAALGGYLRACRWPHGGAITILQGEDMGVPCRLLVGISEDANEGIEVGGRVRPI